MTPTGSDSERQESQADQAERVAGEALRRRRWTEAASLRLARTAQELRSAPCGFGQDPVIARGGTIHQGRSTRPVSSPAELEESLRHLLAVLRPSSAL